MITDAQIHQGRRQHKWHLRFLELAKHIASWSKDPSTQVGAVIVSPQNVVLGLGFNGFPRGVVDHADRYQDREIKYSLVVHAEANAILTADKDLRGCTIYTWPLFTCNECAKLIIQAGITKVVYPEMEEDNIRWQSRYATSKEMYEEAWVDTLSIKMEE